MEKSWVKIFSTAEAYKAEIAKALLLEKDIDSVVINKQDHAYGFGEIELYTSQKKALLAIQILKKSDL